MLNTAAEKSCQVFLIMDRPPLIFPHGNIPKNATNSLDNAARTNKCLLTVFDALFTVHNFKSSIRGRYRDTVKFFLFTFFIATQTRRNIFNYANSNTSIDYTENIIHCEVHRFSHKLHYRFRLIIGGNISVICDLLSNSDHLQANDVIWEKIGHNICIDKI